MPRISRLLLLAASTFAQEQTANKPSPAPSRERKQMRARALDQTRALDQSGSAENQMAPVWAASSDTRSYSSGPAEPVRWDGPQTGTSVYFSKNVIGKRSASGESLDPEELTAAHASLPFGTLLKVTNTKNGKEVTVRIVDRISGGSTHIISVSERAARELDFRRAGIGSVRIMPIEKP